MFMPIERRTSILKVVEKQVFLMKPSIKIVYHSKKNAFIEPNHEKKQDYYVNPCLSQWKDELQF